MTVSNYEKEDTDSYNVVLNHEEQYSIWPSNKEIPPGWRHSGKSGPKAECLLHIKEVWTDMRPLSLRKQMEELANRPDSTNLQPSPKAERETSLVDRLCEGRQPVEAALRPEKTVKRLKEAIDRNYVHVKFTQTKGGTELGFAVDRNASDFSKADFEAEKGTIHLEGNLTLDYTKVRCVADIDLHTLEGKGHLVKV